MAAKRVVALIACWYVRCVDADPRELHGPVIEQTVVAKNARWVSSAKVVRGYGSLHSQYLDWPELLKLKQ